MSNQFNQCPHCGGIMIAGDFEVDGDVWRTVTCEDCDWECNEVFPFSHNETADGNCWMLDDNGDIKVRDLWGEDKSYPRDAWQYDVAENATNLGYWEWVEHQKEIDDNENIILRPSDK
jgi:hypothetical protein